jgi:hypothetical protein
MLMRYDFLALLAFATPLGREVARSPLLLDRYCETGFCREHEVQYLSLTTTICVIEPREPFQWLFLLLSIIEPVGSAASQGISRTNAAVVTRNVTRDCRYSMICFIFLLSQFPDPNPDLHSFRSIPPFIPPHLSLFTFRLRHRILIQ